MLKKTLLMLIVVAGLAAAIVMPAASAHTVVPALAKASTTSCPPGDGGSWNYCEFHCVVPDLQGDSILQAITDLHAADCRLGRITLAVHPGFTWPVVSPKTYSVFFVVRQFPLAGTNLPVGSRVSIWVKFNHAI